VVFDPAVAAYVGVSEARSRILEPAGGLVLDCST
jgi:hypothetical protein